MQLDVECGLASNVISDNAPPDRSASEAKERALDAAERLFMQRGYSAVTIRDIADTLGIRQPSLYHHFPEGKEQIYAEMAERLFMRHSRGMEQAIQAADLDLAEQLGAVARWFAGQPPLNLSSVMHADMPALSQERAQALSMAAYRHLFEPLRQAFRAANERGETRSATPEVMAGAFLAVVEGVQFSRSRSLTRGEMIDEVISVMIDGLRPR